MKKVVLACALLSALGGVASAADIPYRAPPPPPAYYTWTGFYIGGNIGGAWARGSVDDSLFGLSASADHSGFIGGGAGGALYGALTGLSAADATPPSALSRAHAKTTFFMTVPFAHASPQRVQH